MASAILSKAWLNKAVTGLPYTGIFKTYGKRKTNRIRLTDALNYLINNGLVDMVLEIQNILLVREKKHF